MSQRGEESERQNSASAAPHAVLNTRTSFQIFKGEGGVGSAAEFSLLPNEVALPFKILSSEMTLLAALNHVEGNTAIARIYGPSTLRVAETYLSDLLSFIPLGARSSEARKVSINYDAIRRVAVLYGSSDKVTHTIAQLAEANVSTSEASIKDLALIMEEFDAMDKLLRQELKDAGEKVGLFDRSTVFTSQSAKGGETANVNDRSPSNSQTGSRKRTSRSRSEAVETAVEDEPLGESEEQAEMTHSQKSIRLEGGKRSGRAAKKVSQPSMQATVFGRLRGISGAEKKVVNLLNQVIQLIAHVHAVRYNNLLPIFEFLQERVTHAQTIIDTERATFKAAPKKAEPTPEPFQMVSLDGILQAIYNSSQTFKTDEECRYELDSDLLYPIAHACLTEVNRIEGFATAQFVGPSEEELVAKAKAREAAREKREEQRAKVLQRARAKEELLAKREEERRLVRAHLGELDPESLVEDTSIMNPVSSGYVHYGFLPLEQPNQYERALFIWAMLTSLPRPLHLSQMPFSLFLKGLSSDEGRGNGLMEEVVLALLEVAMAALRSSNGLRITTRGKDWFDNMVEFVVVTSGNKKKQVPRVRSLKKDGDGDDDNEDDDDDDDEDEENEENEENEEGEENEESEESEEGAATTGQKEEEGGKSKENEPDDTEAVGSMEATIKSTLQRLSELRQLAAWGNIDMDDRLNLLHYMVEEIFSSPAVQEEVAKLRKVQEEAHSAMEKRAKELREEAEKKVKLLVKNFSSSSSSASHTAETYEETRKKLLSEMQQRLREVAQEHIGMQDGKDIGAIIRPLGMDRYRRLYWRFPFDSHILVQTTVDTDPDFPVLSEPKILPLKDVKTAEAKLLDDDSDDVNSRHTVKNDDGRMEGRVIQRVWGTVPPEYLEQFIEGLDRRGKREAALRRAVEAIQPYLVRMTEPPQGRVTRTRSHAFGYLNKLKLEV